MEGGAYNSAYLDLGPAGLYARHLRGLRSQSRLMREAGVKETGKRTRFYATNRGTPKYGKRFSRKHFTAYGQLKSLGNLPSTVVPELFPAGNRNATYRVHPTGDISTVHFDTQLYKRKRDGRIVKRRRPSAYQLEVGKLVKTFMAQGMEAKDAMRAAHAQMKSM